ncbi:MAG: hypothetical protein UY50_C0022G0017 [Parcubacteria group bacterium GW2011_GWA2_49_9]|nr:MAG: hypothetical protein UY50_C0022G0017 [Parcubacteria group bacterium GW2011_GWA2_49_9]
MYNKNVNEITNISAHSKSFDFLTEEPELYFVADLKKTELTHTPPLEDSWLPLLGEMRRLRKR